MEQSEVQNKRKNKGKIIVGIALLVAGTALLLREFGFQYPHWLISWPMLTIVIALASGVKHQFQNSTWLIMLLIGVVFLAEKIDPAWSVTQYTWPLILIGLGIWFIFGKHKKFDPDRCRKNRKKYNYQDTTTDFTNQTEASEKETFYGKYTSKSSEDNNDSYTLSDETIDTVAVFGGTKKNIVSKNFKGGEIVTIMGGTELNLSHADIKGTVVVEVVQVFGGTKIIIPNGWEVRTEMAAIFGGIDDKRVLQNQSFDPDKILLIKGTSIFGGIEIKSF